MPRSRSKNPLALILEIKLRIVVISQQCSTPGVLSESQKDELVLLLAELETVEAQIKRPDVQWQSPRSGAPEPRASN